MFGVVPKYQDQKKRITSTFWVEAAEDRAVSRFGGRAFYPFAETDSEFEALFVAWDSVPANPKARDILAHWVASYISWHRPDTSKMNLNPRYGDDV